MAKDATNAAQAYQYDTKLHVWVLHRHFLAISLREAIGKPLKGYLMSARNPELLHQIASGPDITLDDWLNMVSIFRERRNRIFGADLFLDPAMAILVALGRVANRAGLPLNALSDAAGVSPDLTRRWLMILAERSYVEELQGTRFKLSADARARLQQVYS